MNWVLILVVAILAGYTLTGYVKGFLKIVYSLVSWILIFVFVIWVTPHIHDYLRDQTNIYVKVVAYCEENIRKQAEKQIESSGIGAGQVLTDNEQLTELLAKLPESLLEDLMDETSDIAYQINEQIDMQGLYNKTAVVMADLILQGVSALVAIILGAILSGFVLKVIGFISKLPLIGLANRICGLAAGAANGLLIVWIGFYLAAVWSATEFGKNIISNIYANQFLIYLYENNLLLSILN